MKKKGFTLVEMLAVIALLGILVLLVLPRVLDYFEKSKKMILIDEAKEIYSEATDKYLEERMVGNKITEISNEDGKNINTISTEGEDINYTIHLDEDGNVTAMKINNGKYCITGLGDFLDEFTVDEVVELGDSSECKLTDLIDGELVTLNLYVNAKDKSSVTGHNTKKLYLRINDGWYYSDRKDATKVTSIETVPYKKNYYFDGFYYNDNKIVGYDGKILTDTNSSNRVFTSAEQLTSEAFAKFEKKYYIVRYNGNTSTGGSMEDTKVLYEESKKLEKNTYTKTGYNYIGWVDEQGNVYADGQDLIVINDDNQDEEDKLYFKFEEDKVLGNNEDNIKTFSAKWEPKKFTITFNTAGGKELSSTDKTKIVTYDSEYGTLPVVYKEGYSFAGWYTSETGGEQIDTSTVVKILDNTTYYAHWGNCPEGYYCPGDNQKYICPVGTYSKANASSCIKCVAGSYQDKEGQSSCINCPAGYYCTGGNQKIASTAGSYSLDGASSSTKCAIGSYQDASAQGSCKACPNGTTTKGTGSTSSSSCVTCSNSANVTGWSTQSWTTSNTVSNLCTISTCSTGYTIKDNKCVDNVAPTCSLTATSSGVSFSSKSDNVGVTSYGLTTSTSATYNGTNSLGLSATTYYGYVKDASGNTGKCSITLIATTPNTYVASTYSYACNPYSYVCGSYSYQCGSSAYVCDQGYSKFDGWYDIWCCCNYSYCTGYNWCTGYNTCTGYNYATEYLCSSGYTKINNSYCYK